MISHIRLERTLALWKTNMKKFTKLLTEIILANTRGRLFPESMAGMEIIC